MPWTIESTRKARTPSRRHPGRKNEVLKEYAQHYSELSVIVGWRTTDSDKIVIRQIPLTADLKKKVAEQKLQQESRAKVNRVELIAGRKKKK